MTMASQELYEGLFVLDPDLPEEALTTAQASIAGQIAKLEGVVKRQQPWGKRRLAYRVRKRRDGFYLLLHFTLPAAATRALDEWCALQEAILRRLIVKAEHESLQPMEAVASHGESE